MKPSADYINVCDTCLVLAVEHDVALSSFIVAMYSTVASNCLYNAWPDYMIRCPELIAYVHYDSKCCGSTVCISLGQSESADVVLLRWWFRVQMSWCVLVSPL